MSTQPIVFPVVLRDPEFRFIKLGGKGKWLKIPKEPGWNIFNLEELKAYLEKKAAQWDADEANGKNAKKKQKGQYIKKRPESRGRLNNYSYDDPQFQEWLKRGKNYGITAAGGLIKLESDDVGRWIELGVLELLPETFTVQSSSPNRQHFYYIGPYFADSPLFDPKTGEDIGHIRGTGESGGRGGMVVGPRSLHPTGARYTVIEDIPIATITAETLDKVKAILSKPRNSGDRAGRKRKQAGRRNSAPRQDSDVSGKIKIDDIAMPTNPVKDDGEEIQGCHPIHGSETGKNFSINPGKNTWHCFRCDSGGGPLEWIAVEAGLINCANAGHGCLRGQLFNQVLDIARGRGYKIPDLRRSNNQLRIIKNRIILGELPEDLPVEPVVVVEGPPRIGKTHWSIKQLIKAGQGNYITHRHSIVKHAIEAFRKEGGQYGIWLEGKHRKDMCRKKRPNCSDCEFCPHDRHSYMELKETASKLLFHHKILTKNQIPSDLCPYYVLKLAEEPANYCFTVVNFIEDIKQRTLTVLDEDPTLAYFYPASAELFRFKKKRYEYKIDNTLGKALEQASPIRNALIDKERLKEEDRALLWVFDTLGGLNEAISTTMSSKSDPEKCYQQMAQELAAKECSFSSDINEKALKKLDNQWSLDQSCEPNIKDFIGSILHLYEKRPIHLISSGRSGYRTVYLIGDASAPVTNMHWTDTAKECSRKILIIGNTLAELFGKSLGDAVVIEIQEFKYRRNFVVVPIDSSGEDSCRGEAKKQKLKVRKQINAVAGDPDSETRRPIMALVGSKEHQERLMRSMGGIAHASQEEGETGQQFNHRGGYVNIFYQNSVVSRGLDVDQYNVMCVYDTDFIQPFWSAAREAGEDNAEGLLNSIMIDETTNSALRISPIAGRNELQPKIIIIPRKDLWKIRYLDEQVLGGRQGGSTPDIEYIARLIIENSLTGTAQLVDGGISTDNLLSRPGWEDTVKKDKLVEYFKVELDRIKAIGKFTDEEISDAANKILKVLKKAGTCKGLSIRDMKSQGLKCKNALISFALDLLHYKGKIKNISNNRKPKWIMIK